MRLFIAEKPSVAKAIATELGITGRGDGFIACGRSTVTWCFGHLLEQADPDCYTPDDGPRTASGRKLWRTEDLPIIPERWLLRPKGDSNRQLAVIGRLLEEATEVVHAGDPDREGQLIVDEVLEQFRLSKPVKRFWVSAQDAVSIRRALGDLRDNADYARMANAARGRQRADWLIGMNLSRAYTLRARRGGSDALLTVGRVQTPTLALVVARDREIEAFKARLYHKLEGRFRHEAGEFVGYWKPKEDQSGLDDEGRLMDGPIADAIVAGVTGKQGTVATYTTEPKTKAPPLCFALSDITVVASRKWGYSAEQVLRACQALYETHRLTSYPRTDSGFLPEVQHADAPAVLAAVRQVSPELAHPIDGADPRTKSPTWNEAKVTAHHGIVPTMHAGDKSALSVPERRMYELIVRRYVAQFHADHEYLQTKVAVNVAGETFTATGNVVTRIGWRGVEPVSDADAGGDNDEKPTKDQALPRMHESDLVTCIRADRKDARTKPLARFTEGSLVRAMEEIHKWVTDPEHKKLLREGDGIGTSATRAAILADLRRRDFLAARGKHLFSTPLGRALIDALPDAVKSPTLTALYERMLRDIELGRAELDTFVHRQARFVAERVAQANAGSVTVPTAGAIPSTPTRAVRRPRMPRRARPRRKEQPRV